MAISAVTPTTSASNSLQLDDLLRVLLTELTHQDPFKPVDNKDFMAQIAQFSALDNSRQLNDNAVQMLALQALSQSIGLIGKIVTATTSSGTVRGTVTSVTLENGAPRLTLRDAGGQFIPNIPIGALELIQAST